MTMREPILKPVPISELRPTQMTVGLREVREKRDQWRAMSGEREAEFLGRHMIPTVLGPRGLHYVLDHHHLARALYEAGVKEVLATVTIDLSALKKASFWIYLDNRAWCHPYDDEGKRQDFEAIPNHISELKDDPYRSLAGELRQAGGYAKDTTPFSEFLWADFLRSRIKTKAIAKDFDTALGKAMTLAKGKDADYLPGWCGPIAS
ncbi:MAG TPA: ParB-like protein [Caulobacteraceae bacterium]|jgi:hypothetical protein|nr:ParB-like protein [Caulobacteraceae bacterium]